MTMDMFEDTWICRFSCNITYLNNYNARILYLWISLPTKYTKLNVQQMLMTSQYSSYHADLLIG